MNIRYEALNDIILNILCKIRTFVVSEDIKLILVLETTKTTIRQAAVALTSGKHIREMYTPLIPHYYIEKLGYAGVYLFFLFLLQNIDCGYSLELPRRGGSNEYPQSMF